jgi:hypothetical protein
MEKQPSRRVALGALASVPALAILPGGSALALGSAASPVHPDAALFAMQSAIEAADRELEAAHAALNTADDAYSNRAPEAPAKPDGPVFTAEEQQALDGFVALTIRKTPLAAWAAYDQAVTDHKRDCERLEAACGVTAAEEMQAVAHKTISRMQAALVDTPATTLAGLIFKARYAAAHWPGEWDAGVMASIVDDLLTMAKDNPPEGPANV